MRESEEITLYGREVLFSSSLHISSMCLVDPVALACGEVVMFVSLVVQKQKDRGETKILMSPSVASPTQ